jgi:ribosomal protein L18
MQKTIDRDAIRRRIRYRIRKKVTGTAAKPRLAVFRSDKHIYAQAIDDGTGQTIAHVSTLDADLKANVKRGGNVDAAKAVGGASAPQGQRDRRRRFRSGRLLVPRTHQGFGRRGARSRFEVLRRMKCPI